VFAFAYFFLKVFPFEFIFVLKKAQICIPGHRPRAQLAQAQEPAQGLPGPPGPECREPRQL